MKLLDIVGARPQFIKVGPILRAVDRHNREHPQRVIEAVRTMRPTPESSAAPYGNGHAAE